MQIMISITAEKLKTAVGFIFEDSSFVYTFGRIKPEEPTKSGTVCRNRTVYDRV